jgi:hypothetical protein
MNKVAVQAAKMLFYIDRDEHTLRGSVRLKQRNLGQATEEALNYLFNVAYTAGAVDAMAKLIQISDDDGSDVIELKEDAEHFVWALLAIAKEVSEDAIRRGGKKWR